MAEIISQLTMKRLQQHAEPLVDTVDSVINRLLDAYEFGDRNPLNKDTIVNNTTLDGANPPNLAFTTVRRVEINGTRLNAAGAKWNGLMIAAIREAKKRLTTEEINRQVIVNHVLGKKLGDGFKYLADVGISIQGQNSNDAWKATYHLLKQLKISCTVEFSWQNNPKAASPGANGTFLVNW